MAERRRQEIEEKKAKLAELRRARDERKALLAQAETAGPSAVQQPLTNRKDVNDLVESLLQRPASPYASSSRGGAGTPLPRAPSALGQSVNRQGTPPPSQSAGVGASVPATPSGRASRLSQASHGQSVSDNAERSGDKDLASHVGQVESGVYPPGMQDASTSTTAPSTTAARSATPPPPAPPKPTIVTYSKGVQTSDMAVGPGPGDVEEEDGADKAKAGGSGRETEEEMRRRILDEIERERQALEAEMKEMKEKQEKLAELSSDQRQAIFAAPDFSSFIEESTRIVQRALSDGYDYIKDYTIGLDGAFDDGETQRVKLACTFSDDRWTAGRSVTDLDWSAKYPELIAASYNKNPSALNDPDGIVAIWNLHLLERPEFIFHAPSDVLSVTFSPYHPNLVFGGTYSGQILLWDTRAKHLPVLKTPLSAAGHTYPIYAMKMVGTQNANSLISSSTDGLVCSWLADMLAQPQEALPLTVANQSKTDEVSITSLDFSSSDTATFFVGTEEGSIHSVNRYDQPSRKAGISPIPEDAYRAHAGPITGLHFHPSTGSLDFGDLFLSSSVDWSVKLWRSKGTKAAPAGSSAANGSSASASAGRDRREREKEREREMYGQTPLHSFENADDYVFDVKWHPHHPAIFGSVDGSGKFDLWNINQDTEVPIISTQVSSRALNKLAFDRTSQSRKAALGGADGKVYVYDLAEKLVTPRDAEWTDMQRALQGMGNRENTLQGAAGDVNAGKERGYSGYRI